VGNPIEMFSGGRIKYDVPGSGTNLTFNFIANYRFLTVQEIQIDVANRISTLTFYNFSEPRFSNRGNRISGYLGLPKGNAVDQMGAIDRGTAHLGKSRGDEADIIC
jgi:hypothetical protein